MGIEYVLTEDGNIKVGENGHPLVRDGDREFELNGKHLLEEKIPELQNENKKIRLKWKEELQKANEKLQAFEGLDPEDARKAIDFMKTHEGKEAKVDEVKKQMQQQYEEKLSEKEKELAERDQQIHKLVVSNSFANSKTINEQTVLPPDVAEAYFGRFFKVEDGKAIAYDSNGNVIYSKEKPGEPASFDEALQSIIEQYPQKDRILKAAPGGGGATPGEGETKARAISRSQFDSLNASEKMSFVKNGGQITE